MKKKLYIIFCLLLFCCIELNAQKTKNNNPFQMVNVPDSISNELDKVYKTITGFDNVNAGKNVWNLINRKDFCFKNGIYLFKGQGPHFPRFLFIYNNTKFYIFTSRYVNKVLEEYIECIKILGLEETDRIKYLQAISIYLQEEADNTYEAGQNNTYQHLDSLVHNYVKELQSQNIDTICVYKDYCVGCEYPIKDESDRCAYSSIYIPTYILWIKQGKTFLSKKDNCFDYSTIEIDSTALWKIFFKNKKHIRKEKVKIFEYVVYENKKKEVYFMMRDHSHHRDFEIIVNTDTVKMEFDDFDLQKHSNKEVNMNYEHNNNLKGKLIVDELEKLTQEIETNKLLEKKRRQIE